MDGSILKSSQDGVAPTLRSRETIRLRRELDEMSRTSIADMFSGIN